MGIVTVEGVVALIVWTRRGNGSRLEMVLYERVRLMDPWVDSSDCPCVFPATLVAEFGPLQTSLLSARVLTPRFRFALSRSW